MKFVSYKLTDKRETRFGALLPNGESVFDFATALDVQPANALDWCDLDGALWPRASAAYDEVVRGDDAHMARLREKGAVVDRARVELLAPIARPGKIICIGLNYRDHAIESKMAIPESPIIFSKFGTCVVGPNQNVILPRTSGKVDYEAEMGVVIGRRAKHVSRERAYDYVFGYVNFNDVSARDYQFADGQWQRGKSCDTFAPMGEYIATADEVPDPHNLAIKFHLNGETLQDSKTDQLIFGIPALIEFLSDSITLEPGDVIATGTPPGVGFARTPPVFLKAGDVMEVEIEGLGTLRNTVAIVEDKAVGK